MKLFNSGNRSIAQTMKGCLSSIAIAATAVTLSSWEKRKKKPSPEAEEILQGSPS